MPTPSQVQLIGGKFQDGQGNLLTNGYLKMVLSQDATIAGVGNICSGIEITIQLDVNGSVSTSPAQYVWGNDVMLPANVYYTVTGYSQAGQPCWGPNIQQVAGGPTFDVGTWIPNQVISWVNPLVGSQVTFEHNGILNSSQLVLNLESTDASVVITDAGAGTLNLQASGGTGSPSGSNLVMIQDEINQGAFQADGNHYLIMRIPAYSILAVGGKVRIQVVMGSLAPTGTVTVKGVIRTTVPLNSDSFAPVVAAPFLTTVPIKFGGSQTVTITGSTTPLFSDTAVIAVDAAHDLHIIFQEISSTGGALMESISAAGGINHLWGEVNSPSIDYTSVVSIANPQTYLAALQANVSGFIGAVQIV